MQRIQWKRRPKAWGRFNFRVDAQPSQSRIGNGCAATPARPAGSRPRHTERPVRDSGARGFPRISTRPISLLVLAFLCEWALAGPCDAYYRFDGNLSDESGNGKTGQMIGPDGTTATAQFVEGRYGQALKLDGSAAMRAFIDLNRDRCPQATVTAWIKISKAASQTILGTGGGSAGPWLWASGSLLGLRTAGKDLRVQDAIYTNGGWMFVAAVWDHKSGTHRLHWHGRQTEQAIGTSKNQAKPAIWVGANNDSLHHSAKDLVIDELRIIGRALEAERIMALRDAPSDAGQAQPEKADTARQACSSHAGCSAGTYCAMDGSCHPDSHRPMPGAAAGTTLEDLQASSAERYADVADKIHDDSPTVLMQDAGSGDADGTDSTPLLDDPRITPDGPESQLTAPDDLPGELPTDSEEWQDAAFEEYQRQQYQEFENEFGPRNRAQVAVATHEGMGKVAFAAAPDKMLNGPADPALGGTSTGAWQDVLASLQELIRLKNTNAYLAITTDGRFAITGQSQGRHTAIVNEINAIAADGRSIDLVAEDGNGYIIVTGLEVRSNKAPPGAVAWAEQQLRLRAQITALALLGDGAWIGVSERGVMTGGMHADHYGRHVREKAAQIASAGERIEDISSAWRTRDGGVTGSWAIATDKQIYFQNETDCDNHEEFGESVQSGLSRDWTCHVPVESCLDDRPVWRFTDMESPTGTDFWDVNVLVTFGVADYDGEEVHRLGCWLERSLRVTEELYDRSPAMRIRLRTRHATEKAGQNLSQMVFASEGDYRRFMEDNFDIVAPTDTSGYFQIVVTDDLKIGDKDIGGRATFPHAVEPFSRKYGIVLEPNEDDDTVLAHEFGHYLGLKHTFEPYGITTNPCNKDYDANWLKMEERYCRSCLSGMDLTNDTCDGAYNVMDYCLNPTPPQQVYVNDCQERRAANTRDRYMNDDGRTRYDRMKGAQ